MDDQLHHGLGHDPSGWEIAVSEAIKSYAFAYLDRYEEVVSCATRLLARQPNWLLGLRITAIAQALAGNLAEARRVAAKLHRLDPSIRLANLREFSPYRRPADLERLIEGLRLAGLPE